MVNLLATNKYIVVTKSILHSKDSDILSMLYQPIIGPIAISLYKTFWTDVSRTNVAGSEYSHTRLMSIMHINIDELLEARRRLEAVGLVRTYRKTKKNIDYYIYQVNSPMSPKEFFEHPVTNTVLYANLGEAEYLNTKEFFKKPSFAYKNYEEITAKFDDVFIIKPQPEIHNELIKGDDFVDSKSANIKFANSDFDMEFFLSLIASTYIDTDKLNKDIKDYIEKLSIVYSIDEITMKDITISSVDGKGKINKEALRLGCKRWYSFEYSNNKVLVKPKKQTITKANNSVTSKDKKCSALEQVKKYKPKEYMKKFHGGKEPTIRDMEIIDSLIIEQGLAPEVVNVLINYVMKKNNRKFNKSYVESIAGHWSRLNILTAEEAYEVIKSEYQSTKSTKSTKSTNNKTSKSKTNNKNLPEWFDKEYEKVEPTKEELEEMKKLFNRK